MGHGWAVRCEPRLPVLPPVCLASGFYFEKFGSGKPWFVYVCVCMCVCVYESPGHFARKR
jgi:hypothetical protein